MKRRTPDHPKVLALATALKIPRYAAVGLLEMLWHFTAEFAPQGDIGRYTDEHIATACGWIEASQRGRIRGGDQGRTSSLGTALVATGFLERHPEVRLTVHDWQDHMPDFVKKQLERKGLKVFVSGQRQTTADNGSLPLPLPSPKPIPHKPAVNSHGSGFDTSPELTIAGKTIPEWVDHLYARHLKKKNRVLIAAVLIKIADTWEPRAKRAGLKTRDELFQLIDRAHLEESTSIDWVKEHSKYCPTLDKWLEDEGYTAHAARASPDADYYPPSDVEIWRKEQADRIARGEEC